MSRSTVNGARTTVAEIQSLLARYGYGERAAVVGSVVSIEQDEEFWAVVGGLEFWAGRERCGRWSRST